MTSTVTASETRDDVSDAGVGVTIEDLWKVYGASPQREREIARNAQLLGPYEHATIAVRDVSFDVRPGETFVIMGLSGSGKSTLVRCLTRLVEPTAGSIRIGGVDVRAMSGRQLRDARGSDWAMVFQHFGLLPHRRVLQNVAYGLEIRGVPRSEREERACEMIDLVGLNGVENKYPHELSGGMKQRVGLARALAVRPKLLLLDEPFSALDPLIRTDLQDQLLRLAELGGQTSIFITHDLSEALKLGDRIAIMRNGELVQVGTPEDIVLRPVDDYVRRFALEAPRAKVVTAKTAARTPVQLEGRETVEQARGMLRAAGASTAVVRKPVPFVLNTTQLALADARADVETLRHGEVELVSEHAKLWDVMAALTRTRNPVIVQNARGDFVGTVDSSAVIEALGVPTDLD